MTDVAASVNLQSEAFKRLYPDEFYAKFIAEGVRPDGRPLGRPRPVSVGLGSIGTADASAHVKARVRREHVAANAPVPVLCTRHIRC